MISQTGTTITTPARQADVLERPASPDTPAGRSTRGMPDVVRATWLIGTISTARRGRNAR